MAGDGGHGGPFTAQRQADVSFRLYGSVGVVDLKGPARDLLGSPETPPVPDPTGTRHAQCDLQTPTGGLIVGTYVHVHRQAPPGHPPARLRALGAGRPIASPIQRAVSIRASRS